MLELRPTCENCNQPLPPASLEARICSYEVTGNYPALFTRLPGYAGPSAAAYRRSAASSAAG